MKWLSLRDSIVQLLNIDSEMMDQLEKMHGPIQRGVSPSHDEVVLVISQCGQIDAKPTCDGPMNSPTPVLVQIWHMQHGNIPWYDNAIYINLCKLNLYPFLKANTP